MRYALNEQGFRVTGSDTGSLVWFSADDICPELEHWASALDSEIEDCWPKSKRYYQLKGLKAERGYSLLLFLLQHTDVDVVCETE